MAIIIPANTFIIVLNYFLRLFFCDSNNKIIVKYY